MGGTVIGVLALDRMGERTFADAELESAELFANLAAIAIQNARQYEEAERRPALGAAASQMSLVL